MKKERNISTFHFKKIMTYEIKRINGGNKLLVLLEIRINSSIEKNLKKEVIKVKL